MCIRDRSRGVDWDGTNHDTFTAAQMCAYAREAIAAARRQGQGGGEVFGWVRGDAFVDARYWTADTPPQGWTPVYRSTPPSASVGVGYAKQLATSLWQRHYREDAPQWEPFDDILGLLSQIDNMVSGLTRSAQQPAAVDGALRSAAERLVRKAVTQSRTTSSVFTSDVEALERALAAKPGGSDNDR